MKKVTLAFELLSFIVAVTILKACASLSSCPVPTPALTPSGGHFSGSACNVSVAVATGGTPVDYLLIISGVTAKMTPSPTHVTVTATSGGTTLTAKAHKCGGWSSVASGTYYCDLAPRPRPTPAPRP